MNNSQISKNYIVSHTSWLIRWRWPVVIATLAVIGFIASGARHLWMGANYRAYFAADNPQLAAFEKLQNIYANNDNIFFVLAPKDGKAFSNSTLDAVEALTAEAWKIPIPSGWMQLPIFSTRKPLRMN